MVGRHNRLANSAHVVMNGAFRGLLPDTFLAGFAAVKVQTFQIKITDTFVAPVFSHTF